MRWFNADTGLWGTYWWQGATVLTSFNDIAYLDDNIKSVYNSVWDNTYKNAAENKPYYWRLKRDDESSFSTSYLDDNGWWALAWLGAWDNTGRDEYLNEAKLLYDDIRTGLDADQCGGISWKKESDGSFTGPLAISNCMFTPHPAQSHPPARC